MAYNLVFCSSSANVTLNAVRFHSFADAPRTLDTIEKGSAAAAAAESFFLPGLQINSG